MHQSVKQSLVIAGAVLVLTVVILFGTRSQSSTPNTVAVPSTAQSAGFSVSTWGPSEAQPVTAPAPYVDPER